MCDTRAASHTVHSDAKLVDLLVATACIIRTIEIDCRSVVCGYIGALLMNSFHVRLIKIYDKSGASISRNSHLGFAEHSTPFRSVFMQLAELKKLQCPI